MNDKVSSKEPQKLGMDADITRRDFMNSTMIASGAALLAMNAPGLITPAKAQGLTSEDWDGPSGVGDYKRSNGNTSSVVNAAHRIRDGEFKDSAADVIDTGETLDMIIVGGGFAGLGAAFTFMQEQDEGKRCLILENHPIFGGEAKQNEFDVDGHRLYAPQGSNGMVWPPRAAQEMGFLHRYWFEVGLPDELTWKMEADGTDKDLRFARDNFTAMGSEASNSVTGYQYVDKETGKRSWTIDPWLNDFEEAPVSEELRVDLKKFINYKFDELPDNWEKWLDSMTFQDLLTKEMGLHPDISKYVQETAAASGAGLNANVISALAAIKYYCPPAEAIYNAAPNPFGEVSEDLPPLTLVSFPGGNCGIARHFVKKMIPDAIEGGTSMSDILYNPLNWDALDRKEQQVRIRNNSLVIDVEHMGSVEDADYVRVIYSDVNSGKKYSIKAKSVVMCGQGHSNKYILKDMPKSYADAYEHFHHAPMLTVNVALRNWRFMEKLGITAARWFDGFGWFTNLRAPMVVDGKSMPLHPDEPNVLTFYIPFLNASQDEDMATQALEARYELFNYTYRELELKVREKMTELFGDHGFDAKRDIAGIVTNRWGHAYVVPEPGFYYGKDGEPAPRDIIQQGYGRVSFGHSELTGQQLWDQAIGQGERAARQLFKFL